ncbi:MAG: hypothetical protein QNJ63_16945 [Calothrix sp. MO_192.B10]|nr:hypothetical protein [Calothrix sp. MO_192.B10]
MLKNPGIGCPDVMDDSGSKHHNALNQVQISLRELAADLGVELPEGYPATPTIT